MRGRQKKVLEESFVLLASWPIKTPRKKMNIYKPNKESAGLESFGIASCNMERAAHAVSTGMLSRWERWVNVKRSGRHRGVIMLPIVAKLKEL